MKIVKIVTNCQMEELYKLNCHKLLRLSKCFNIIINCKKNQSCQKLPTLLKWSKIFNCQKSSKNSKIVKNCQDSQKLSNLAKSAKTLKNCQKLSKLSKFVKTLKNCQKCQNSQKLSKVVKNC